MCLKCTFHLSNCTLLLYSGEVKIKNEVFTHMSKENIQEDSLSNFPEKNKNELSLVWRSPQLSENSLNSPASTTSSPSSNRKYLSNKSGNNGFNEKTETYFNNNTTSEKSDLNYGTNYAGYSVPGMLKPSAQDVYSSNAQICGVGTVLFIQEKYGFIESDFKQTKIFFPLKASIGVIVGRLSDTYKSGDRVAFVAHPQPSKSNCLYCASNVCPERNLLFGYGTLDYVGSTFGYINAVGLSAIKIVGRIFFPQRMYKKQTTLKNVPLNELLQFGAWVKFRALPQSPANDIWVAVDVALTDATGIIVKVGETFGYVWSRMIGKVFLSTPYVNGEKLVEGDWIEFEFFAQQERNFCRWKTGEMKKRTPLIETFVTEQGVTTKGVGCLGKFLLFSSCS